MGALKPWHIVVLVVVLILLFGAKRLPDAARSLGRSLRIIKAETKGLVDDDRATSPRRPTRRPRASRSRRRRCSRHVQPPPVVDPVQRSARRDLTGETRSSVVAFSLRRTRPDQVPAGLRRLDDADRARPRAA